MRTIEKKLVDLYFANLDLIEEGLPHALNRHRGDAIQSFNLLGLPGRKVEKYKYTDVRSRYEGDFEKFFTPFGTWDDSWEPVVRDACVIRLLNGYSYGDEVLTTLEDGTVYGSLRAAANQYPELVSKYYNRLADNGSDAVASLNTAFVQDGAFIYLPKNVVLEKPVVVIQGCRAEENAQVYSRLLIVAEENSEANIVLQSYASGPAFLVNQLAEVHVGKNARVEIVEVQQENGLSTLLTNSFVRQANNSSFRSVAVTAAGGMIRNNTDLALEGRGIESHLYGLFIAGAGEHMDNYTNIEHRMPDCASFEDFRGVASADGVGAFNGRILVAPDAQRTRAFQENHNLLLSDEAAIYTKPQLEIYADDVKCTHGATIGQLDPQAVFYMRQRGLGEEEARKLQLYGFVRTIIDKISLRDVAEAVDVLVTAKIDRL